MSSLGSYDPLAAIPATRERINEVWQALREEPVQTPYDLMDADHRSIEVMEQTLLYFENLSTDELVVWVGADNRKHELFHDELYELFNEAQRCVPAGYIRRHKRLRSGWGS